MSNERDVLDSPPTAGENAWQLFAAIARRQEIENFMMAKIADIILMCCSILWSKKCVYEQIKTLIAQKEAPTLP